MTRACRATPDDRARPEVQAQRPHVELLRTIGASSTPRGSADLSKWRPPMPDQNGFEGCTAHAAGSLIYQRLAILGRPLAWVPSFLGIWSDALLVEAAPGTTAAQLAAMNAGVQSVSAMIAIGHGVRPMGPLASGRFSDVVTGPIAPGLDQMTTAAMAPIVGEYRIDEGQPNWTEDACVLLDNEIPIYLGINVGPEYMRWVASMPPIDDDEAAGSSLGGHAVRIDKYETTQSGARVFSSPGSYGLSYFDQGVALFTARALEARTFDSYPFDVRVP